VLRFDLPEGPAKYQGTLYAPYATILQYTDILSNA